MRRPGQHLLPLPPCRAEWCPGGHAVGALGGQSPCWCPGRQSLCWCPEGVTLLVPCGVGEWGGGGGHTVGASVWVGLQLQTTITDRVLHKTKQNSLISRKKGPKKQSHFQFYSS